MSKSNVFENKMSLHYFNNQPMAGHGDATGLPASAVAGNYYASMHSADPGEAGNQSTNELSYTGYARVAIPRTTAGFTVTNNVTANAAAVVFPPCTAGSGTATWIQIGTSPTGTGEVLYRYQLSNPSSLAISAGITPEFAPGLISSSED